MLRRLALLIPSLLVVLLAAPRPAASQAADDLDARLAELTPLQLDEVVWLARCLYSESDRADEQRLVAWVVRNRVETGFRGTTYRSVVLEPRQFSAFNRPTPRRRYLLGLDAGSGAPAWRSALAVALDVYRAPADTRPFEQTTRHFYSPVSMPGGAVPHWAADVAPLDSKRLGVDPHRFLFFDGLDEGLDVAATAPAPTLSAGERIEAKRASVSLREARARMQARRARFSGRVPRPARPSRQAP